MFFDGLDEVFDSTLGKEAATAIYRFADECLAARVVVPRVSSGIRLLALELVCSGVTKVLLPGTEETRPTNHCLTDDDMIEEVDLQNPRAG